MQTVNMLEAKSTLSRLVDCNPVPRRHIHMNLLLDTHMEPMRLITHDAVVARYSDIIILV